MILKVKLNHEGSHIMNGSIVSFDSNYDSYDEYCGVIRIKCGVVISLINCNYVEDIWEEEE